MQRLGVHGNWRGVLALLRRLEEDGSAVNHIMYNASMAALAKNARWKEAVAILDRMTARGVFRDDRSFCSAMDACRAARKPDQAYDVLSEMREQWANARGEAGGRAAKPTPWCFNTVLAAFAKEGQARRALSLVEVDMAEEGVTPDHRTWSTLIDAYRAGGESGRETVALLERMKRAGAEPDIWCFNHCLNAASRRGEWELAFELLERMGREGVEPNSWSYSAVMKACANAEEWELVPVSFVGPTRGPERALGICCHHISCRVRVAVFLFRESWLEETSRSKRLPEVDLSLCLGSPRLSFSA